MENASRLLVNCAAASDADERSHGRRIKGLQHHFIACKKTPPQLPSYGRRARLPLFVSGTKPAAGPTWMKGSISLGCSFLDLDKGDGFKQKNLR